MFYFTSSSVTVDIYHSSRLKYIVPSSYFFPLKLGMIIIGAFLDLGASESGSWSLLSLHKSVPYGGDGTGCPTSSLYVYLYEIGGGGASKLGEMGVIGICFLSYLSTPVILLDWELLRSILVLAAAESKFYLL